VSAANSENPLMVQDSGSKPFQVEVIPCNSFGCSSSFSMGETLFPAAPDLVVIRVTGPSQLSLQLVAPPSIASASELSFVVAGMLPCITVYIGFTISFSALLQRPVPSLCCFGGFFANSCFLCCAQSKIKCGWIMFQYLLSGSPSISTMETSTYLDPVQLFRVTKLELGEAQMPATRGRINAMPMTKKSAQWAKVLTINWQFNVVMLLGVRGQDQTAKDTKHGIRRKAIVRENNCNCAPMLKLQLILAQVRAVRLIFTTFGVAQRALQWQRHMMVS
jgi:hypothetical protein